MARGAIVAVRAVARGAIVVMRAAAEWEIESKGSESEARETLCVQRVQPLSCVHVATRGRVHSSTSQERKKTGPGRIIYTATISFQKQNNIYSVSNYKYVLIFLDNSVIQMYNKN